MNASSTRSKAVRTPRSQEKSCPARATRIAVTEARLRGLHCGSCVVVDLHVHSWYATAAVLATPQHA